MRPLSQYLMIPLEKMETIRGTERDQHIEFLRSKRVAQTWFLWWQAPDFCSFSPLTVIQMQLCLAGQMRKTFAPHMWGPFYFCKHIFYTQVTVSQTSFTEQIFYVEIMQAFVWEHILFSHKRFFSQSRLRQVSVWRDKLISLSGM